MRDLAFEVIGRAAEEAGLPQGRVMGISAKDNLTLPRPRLEVQFFPESFSRTGRKLGIRRGDGEQAVKRELYEVRLDLNVNVLAADENWLAAFELAFVRELPRGANDSQGNWVKIMVREARFGALPAKRIGAEANEIKVGTKVGKLYSLVFIGRVTREDVERLIGYAVIIKPKWGDS